MKVYLAAPLFTAAEQAFNADLATMLRCEGHIVFVPQESDQTGRGGLSAVFAGNVAAIRSADAVVAVLDGSDVDSGTAWECGFAFASAKPVFGLRTDVRVYGPYDEIINLQVMCGLKMYSHIKPLLRELSAGLCRSTKARLPEHGGCV